MLDKFFRVLQYVFLVIYNVSYIMFLILLVHIFIMNENVKSCGAFDLPATLATD